MEYGMIFAGLIYYFCLFMVVLVSIVSVGVFIEKRLSPSSSFRNILAVIAGVGASVISLLIIYAIGAYVSFNYPIEASAVWFFLIVLVIIAIVFWQTRHPKGIHASIENSLTKGQGFVLSNDTGNDLYECTVSIREVDSKPVMHKNLEWGTSPDLRGEILTIKQMGKSPVSLNRVYSSVQSIADQDQLAGKHELELFFRGNKHNGEVVSMPIYVMVRMEVEAEIRQLFVEKVEI